MDEVGELPLSSQAKLLRVLQEREFERVGGSKTIKVDVRIIAATNCDLEAMVAEGRFRKDLLYRLSVFVLETPPLRIHPEDIPLLVPCALIKAVERAGLKCKVVMEAEGIAALSCWNYPWPGNVREFENTIERLAITAAHRNQGVITAAAVYAVIDAKSRKLSLNGDTGYPANAEWCEFVRCRAALEATQWNTAEAARLLKKPRTTLQSQMDRWKRLGWVC